MDGKQYCRDRGYLTAHVTPLPRRCHLSDAAPWCHVNYATTDQIDEMKNLVELAEERGDGVGKGEFLQGSRRSDLLYNRSEIFTVTIQGNLHNHDSDQQSSKSADAFIAIYPCLYARGFDTCLATIRIFRATLLATDDIAFRSLIRLAVGLADEIKCGYTHAVIDATLSHLKQLQAFRDEGFMVTGIIPHNVYLNGVGECENVVLVKRFNFEPRIPRSTATVLEMLHRVDPCDDFTKQDPSLDLPQIPGGPRRAKLSCGITVIARNMQKDDDKQVFEILTDCVEKGEGLVLNEFASLDYFRMHSLANGYVIVYEDEAAKKLFAIVNISESTFSRGWRPAGRVGMVVSPEYRGKGIGPNLLTPELFTGFEFGYFRFVSATLLSNARITSRHTRFTREQQAVESQTGELPTVVSRYAGVIPHAGYVKGAADWDDLLIMDYMVVAANSQL